MLSTSILTAIFSAMNTAITMRLFCEEECRGKIRISTPYSSAHSHEQSIPNVVGTLYDKVELTKKDLPLKYSKNVAYKSTSKK